MTAGYTVSVANTMLDTIAPWYVQLHTDDPGAAGTAHVSSFATRFQVFWNPASGGSKTISNAPQFSAAWTGTSPETVTFLSFWDAPTSGNFKFSLALGTNAVTIVTNAPVNLTGVTVTLAPLAA
jgi:hypothetical protein